MLIASVPETDRGKSLRVGDEVRVVGTPKAKAGE